MEQKTKKQEQKANIPAGNKQKPINFKVKKVDLADLDVQKADATAIQEQITEVIEDEKEDMGFLLGEIVKNTSKQVIKASEFFSCWCGDPNCNAPSSGDRVIPNIHGRYDSRGQIKKKES